MCPLILLFFVYFISSPHFSLADQSNFINLSDWDFWITSVGFDSIQIQILSTSRDKDFKVMVYNGTHWSTSKMCVADEFLNLKVLIKQRDITASLSFNVSCQTEDYLKKAYVIKDVKESIKTDSISVFWNTPSPKIKYYLIYFMNENNENITFTTDETEATFSRLEENWWYQFCIATIDESWITSKFFCKNILTYFVEIGPVRNVNAFSKSDKIFISQYKYDIPHGYLLYNYGDTDCFTDCYTEKEYYMGIRSLTVDGEICINWKNSVYSKYRTTKSNICSSSDYYRPWCPIGNSYKFCDVPLCSTIGYRYGCVNILEKEESSESLTIKWIFRTYVNIIGYLTLLHNLDHSCEQYYIQLCNTCGSISNLENHIKGFYWSCSSGNYDYTISYKAIFTNLHQDRTYIVYIIPIFDKKRTGEVKKVTIHTKLTKPKIPIIISLKSESLNEIQIAWDKSGATRTNVIVTHYSLRIRTSNPMDIDTKDVKTESYKFTNLKPCCKYCIQIAAVNDGGTSNFTEEVCEYTLGPKPGLVKVEKPDSGYISHQKIKWKYLGNDVCSKIFRLYGQKKFTADRFELTSDKEFLTIEGWKRNLIYTVKVRAESQMKTLNDESIGEYSEIVEFYTGNVNPNVSYYNQTFDDTFKKVKLKWGIEEQMKGAIFEFIIVLMNSSKLCTKMMRVSCRNCTNLAKTTFLSQSDYDLQERLAKECEYIQNEKFDADQIDFHYTFKDDEVGNFSVEIFAISLLGVKSIYKISTNISPPKGVQWKIIIVVIIGILIGVIIVVLLMKRNPYLFQRRHKNLNEGSNAFMLTMGNISEKENHLVRVIDFAAYYDRVSKNDNSELIKDYKYMTKETKVLEASLGLTVEAGNDDTNARKNQFINILPFDQSRVKIGDRGFPFDYINASYIPFSENEEDFEYIASQGPIETTLADFWQMVLEQNIYLIIMLTNTMEGDKVKCFQYWPENINERISYSNKNQYKVTLLKEVNEESFIERDLRLENSTNKECREIKQLQMHTWLVHSAPDLDMFDKLLFRFQEIQVSNNSFPYLIHCSAGVGRTGTLICIDRIIKDLINGNENINIYDTVLKLRRYRNFMVQRQAQYIFIHEYVNHFIKKYMPTKMEDSLYLIEE